MTTYTHKDIQWRDELIAHLHAENLELSQRLREVERRLGLDSQNSSKPPSTDSLLTRKKRPKTKGSKKKRGAQKGHEGSHRLLWEPERVDTIVAHFPSSCSCGHEFEARDAIGLPQRHQVFDLPSRLIQCTEHHLFACQCAACGEVTRATLKPETRKGFGPRLVALLGTLSVMLRAPRRGLLQFMSEVLEVPASLGGVVNALEETSQALGPAWHQVKRALSQDARVGIDETGWALAGSRHWLWVLQSPRAALFRVAKRRSQMVAFDLLKESQAQLILSDRYGAYHWIEPGRHQVCRAHLLRDWEAISQRAGPLGTVGDKLVKLEKRLHRGWRKHQNQKQSWQEFVRQATTIRQAMEKVCWRAKGQKEKCPAVLDWMVQENGQRAWTFLEHEGSDLTNNASERALRGPVIQRKISWGSNSLGGCRLMERLWSVSETCRLGAQDVLTTITAYVQAHRTQTAPPALI